MAGRKRLRLYIDSAQDSKQDDKQDEERAPMDFSTDAPVFILLTLPYHTDGGVK
jgi:hypothetical protein